MKQSFLYILLIALGCSKMDDSYKNLIEPGGRVYVEKAKAVVRPGYKKVEIVWPRASDPNVSSAKVYWNNYSDSVSINISPGEDTVHVPVTGLQEQFYTFIVKTFDKNGNSSVPVEVNGRAYGDTYLAALTNRFISSAAVWAGILTINWGAAAVYNGEVGLQLIYKDTTGVQQKLFISNTQTASVISDFAADTRFEYRSLFLADSNAVDTIYKAYSLVSDIKLDKTKWSVVAFSDQHDEPGGGAAAVIDGTFTTRWHTQANPTAAPYPHWVIVDMKSEHSFTRFGVERTNKDAPAGDPRGPNTFQVQISKDNITWTDLGIFNFNRLADGEQFFPITSTATGRYFKFTGLTGEGPYMVLGEISAYGL
ncbi:DUF4998 domain-containing protein [Niabella beijingensis]|uniref:DUF4998 domain-containing protein n=1 Tax=Niabella beijingensis TaxID=2872700 RepID=UPI001CBD1B20|nr:DUF4998 domain-containing protein [Niabella beijingensis]MBZ4190722.1 discoidin domain-containing protein [Niabella beijingensis]